MPARRRPRDAGNVLRPFTEAKLSLRVPPTADAKKASAALKEILEADPPYGARVRYDGEKDGSGWNAPKTAPWLEAALEDASHAAFGKPVAMMGEGGSIPFMGMLGREIPGGAVRGDRRARAALECARAERVPAHPDRQARDGSGRARAGRARRALAA